MDGPPGSPTFPDRPCDRSVADCASCSYLHEQFYLFEQIYAYDEKLCSDTLKSTKWRFVDKAEVILRRENNAMKNSP